MGQIQEALRGRVTEEIEVIAKKENIPQTTLRESVAKGRVVILRHINRKPKQFCGIGKGLKTKINVNIGTSPGIVDLAEEEKKINVSERLEADTIMDLSTGGDLDQIRHFILRRTQLPVGTVPIYQAVVEAKKQYGNIKDMTVDDIYSVIEKHADSGVDFMTVHCGVRRNCLDILKKHPRTAGVVSRGGAFLLHWMKLRNEENPLFSQFDRLLDIASCYDIVLSLGDGMRPGCIADGSDKAQITELKTLAKLAKKALKRGVQVIIEGPGHLPINHIKKNIKLQKRITHGAPFYVLGPVVTDIAPGYDHITGAIGGALIAAYGADFLCYLTPAEHLRLPTVEDVKEGVIASKIAAHAGDIAKGIPNAGDKDLTISKARFRRDWEKQIELAVDPEKARLLHESRPHQPDDVCTMCGEFCSLKIVQRIMSDE